MYLVARQTVAQLDTLPRERSDRLQAALLKVDMEAGLGGELLQQRKIGIGRRVEHAKHQHHRTVPHGHLDLRHPIADTEALDQSRQRRELIADARVQHVAARDVGHEGRAALAKADQHATLLGHPAHTETGLAPIAPMLSRQRLQPALRLHLADAPQHVRQDRLFGRDLRGRVHVLQGAAAADTKTCTARHHPLWCRLQHLGHDTLVVATLHAGVAEQDPFASQCAVHKHRLAVDVGQTAAVVGQGFDPSLKWIGRKLLAFFLRHRLNPDRHRSRDTDRHDRR